MHFTKHCRKIELKRGCNITKAFRLRNIVTNRDVSACSAKAASQLFFKGDREIIDLR